MANFTQLTNNLAIISALSDLPNQLDGLSSSQLKAKFDEASGLIKTFLNSTLISELEASGASAKIGAIVGGIASNLQTFITAVEAAGTGTLPPSGAVTNTMMATDVKIGSLASLTTTTKTSLQAAINELVTTVNSYKTTADLTIYVNGGTGSNTTGTGAVGSPYQTIDYALSTLPKHLSHTISIYADNISSGGFTITNFSGGRINIFFSTTTACTFTTAVSINNNTSRITLQSNGTTNFSYTGAEAIYLRNNTFVWLVSLLITASATTKYGISADWANSFVFVSGCTISNRSVAIYSSGSHVISSSQGGTGNTTVLSAVSGVIMKDGTQPAGTTAESATKGGVIR